MIKQAKRSSYNTIPIGAQIKGTWHHNEYIVRKFLGMGAIGAVYLCTMNGKYVALKISEKNTSITIEVNVLKALQKVQGHSLGPSLYDVDDWKSPDGNTYSFYTMEYINGERMDTFIKRHGSIWIGPFLLQLLNDLEILHGEGWIFGDLKMDNIIINSRPPRVRLIDVGGTTQQGRAIKEYTEFYDRGYWQLGSRRAEPSYDLFAVVMVFIQLFYPNRFPKKGESLPLLMNKISNIQTLTPFKKCFEKALKGRYNTSDEMKNDVLYIVAHQNASKRTNHSHVSIWKKTMYRELISITTLALGACGVAWLFTM